MRADREKQGKRGRGKQTDTWIETEIEKGADRQNEEAESESN